MSTKSGNFMNSDWTNSSYLLYQYVAKLLYVSIHTRSYITWSKKVPAKVIVHFTLRNGYVAIFIRKTCYILYYTYHYHYVT